MWMAEGDSPQEVQVSLLALSSGSVTGQKRSLTDQDLPCGRALGHLIRLGLNSSSSRITYEEVKL